MVGTSKEPSSFKLALILTIFVLAVGANSAMITVGKFVRVSMEPGNVMSTERQSRSVRQCAAMCLSARCCSPQPCCTAYCQSQTSSVCYLNMTSESPLQPLPDTSLGYKCFAFVREKPGCPSCLGYRLIRGQCAKLYIDAITLEEARSQCEDDGGHLYYFTDLTTDEPVIIELPNVERGDGARYWVGADRLTTSDYQWHDGSHLSDSDPLWRQSYPTRGNKTCVALRTDYMRLQDYPCDLATYFICQIDV